MNTRVRVPAILGLLLVISLLMIVRILVAQAGDEGARRVPADATAFDVGRPLRPLVGAWRTTVEDQRGSHAPASSASVVASMSCPPA